jgi:hypothetical protein
MSNNVPTHIVSDLPITRELIELRKKHKWPIVMNHLKIFAKNDILSKLWKHKGLTCHHTMVSIPENMFTNKTCRTKCTLVPRLRVNIDRLVTFAALVMFDCDDDKETDDGVIYDDEDNSYSFLGTLQTENYCSSPLHSSVRGDYRRPRIL